MPSHSVSPTPPQISRAARIAAGSVVRQQLNTESDARFEDRTDVSFVRPSNLMVNNEPTPVDVYHGGLPSASADEQMTSRDWEQRFEQLVRQEDRNGRAGC